MLANTLRYLPTASMNTVSEFMFIRKKDCCTVDPVQLKLRVTVAKQNWGKRESCYFRVWDLCHLA